MRRAIAHDKRGDGDGDTNGERDRIAARLVTWRSTMQLEETPSGNLRMFAPGEPENAVRFTRGDIQAIADVFRIAQRVVASSRDTRDGERRA